MTKLIFATRPSALARWQTQWVINALQAVHPGLICEEKIISTQGDRVIDTPLPEIGGKGLFTQELENELRSGKVDCAVHSLKDLPVESTEELTIGCIPIRADVRDVLISQHKFTLASLPAGACIGTSSLRRAAQVLAARPDLMIASLRGNVDTRVRKILAGQYDAIILAGAGLTRLGLDDYVTEWMSMEIMLPAPGQGALAVQCRSNDQATLQLLARLDDPATRMAVTAERSFLIGLRGGCSVPVAAFGQVSSISDWMENEEKSATISLTGLVISTDGKQAVKITGDGSDASQLGTQLAQQAIAKGADDILRLANKPTQEPHSGDL